MCLQECTVVGNGFLCLFPFLFAEEGFCCHESWSGIGFFRSSGSSEGISVSSVDSVSVSCSVPKSSSGCYESS